MYSAILIAHSWLRYPVLVAGIALLALALGACLGRRTAAPKIERAHLIFLSLLDSQMTLGLLLYFWLSPLTAAAMVDLAATMKEPELRFFGIEHISTMVIAVTAAHLGRARAKRVPTEARGKIVLLAQLVWLFLTLLAIPWPEFYITRPLLR
ncbi:MAG: hypothetical protein GY910_23815 [bacterium]|nr:hypothetical protein [Deltaproteobacteria bacterium]MCP4908011.1 hypothetical protein [bacterium]